MPTIPIKFWTNAKRFEDQFFTISEGALNAIREMKHEIDAFHGAELPIHLVINPRMPGSANAAIDSRYGYKAINVNVAPDEEYARSRIETANSARNRRVAKAPRP